MNFLDRISKWFAQRSVPVPAVPRAPIARPRDRDAVMKRLRVLVAELSDRQLSPEEVDPRASLLEEAVLDSVAGAELLAFIEDHYGVVIEEIELAGGLRSLEDVARRVVADAESTGS